MTDEAQTGDPQQPQRISVKTMPLVIHAQYAKDISFENPNAPESLRPTAGKPDMKINVNMELNPLPGTADDTQMYEVSLRLRCVSKRGDTTAFVAEIDYAAAVSVGEGVAQDTLHPLMLIEVPRLIFPFARQILAELSQQGGYPPLMIGPVDFQQLYIQRFAPDMQQQAGE